MSIASERVGLVIHVDEMLDGEVGVALQWPRRPAVEGKVLMRYQRDLLFLQDGELPFARNYFVDPTPADNRLRIISVPGGGHNVSVLRASLYPQLVDGSMFDDGMLATIYYFGADYEDEVGTLVKRHGNDLIDVVDGHGWRGLWPHLGEDDRFALIQPGDRIIFGGDE